MLENKTSSINLRVDSFAKEKAAALLAQQGMTLSFALQRAVDRIIEEEGMPVRWLRPNKETKEAVADAKAGKDMTQVDSMAQLINEVRCEDATEEGS